MCAYMIPEDAVVLCEGTRGMCGSVVYAKKKTKWKYVHLTDERSIEANSTSLDDVFKQRSIDAENLHGSGAVGEARSLVVTVIGKAINSLRPSDAHMRQ